jgi:hypothetical protein
MSTLTSPPAPAIQRPPLSASLVALLNAIARGASKEAVLVIREHGGPQHKVVNTTPAHRVAVVPPLVLNVLEKSMSPWTLDFPTRLSSATGSLGSISALSVSRTFEQTFRPVYWKGRQMHGSSSWEWPAEVALWRESLEGGALPPTMIVSALPKLHAIWSLRSALPLRTEANRAGVYDLLGQLIRAVGADPLPVDEPFRFEALSVPLPGTATRNSSPAVVDVASLVAGRVYEVSDVWAAIRAAEEK